MPTQMSLFETDDPDKFDGIHEGIPFANPAKYFDVTDLPDAVQRQRVVDGVFILYVVFPTWETLKEGMRVLTGGERSGLAKTSRIVTLSSTAITKKNGGIPMIDFWKKKIFGDKQEDQDGQPDKE